jgi:hypothetical protein
VDAARFWNVVLQEFASHFPSLSETEISAVYDVYRQAMHLTRANSEVKYFRFGIGASSVFGNGASSDNAAARPSFHSELQLLEFPLKYQLERWALNDTTNYSHRRSLRTYVRRHSCAAS